MLEWLKNAWPWKKKPTKTEIYEQVVSAFDVEYKKQAVKRKPIPKKALWPKDFDSKDVAKALNKQAPKPTKEKQMAVAKKSVAKKVTKEMEYDYKTGKKSFAGSTAKKDAHAEKEGKRVAKALAYDINKAKKK